MKEIRQVSDGNETDETEVAEHRRSHETNKDSGARKNEVEICGKEADETGVAWLGSKPKEKPNNPGVTWLG